MKNAIACLLLLMASTAAALEVKVNVPKARRRADLVLARVEAATGLNFEAKCSNWTQVAPPKIGYTCDSWLPVHGEIVETDTGVVIVLYEAKTIDARTVASSLTAAQRASLKSQIEAVAP